MLEELKKETMNLNDDYTEKDILIAACGEDIDGFSKAITAIRLEDINCNNGDIRTVDEILLDSPIINIFRTKGTTTVDLTFTDSNDYEFMNTVARLNDFMKASFSPDGSEVIRSICVTITPKEVFTDFLSTGIYGVWNLQPSNIGGSIDTIRFFFDNDYFQTFRLPSLNDNK